MQIVIDIPEEMYKWVDDVNKFFNYYGTSDFVNLIKNGTPLPKGHGRLIDADDIKSYFSDREGGDFTAFHFYDTVENAPTIIEADKESEDG